MQSIDAGAVDAERPQRGRGMPAEWTQNTRSVDAGRTQTHCQVISWQYCSSHMVIEKGISTKIIITAIIIVLLLQLYNLYSTDIKLW